MALASSARARQVDRCKWPTPCWRSRRCWFSVVASTPTTLSLTSLAMAAVVDAERERPGSSLTGRHCRIGTMEEPRRHESRQEKSFRLNRAACLDMIAPGNLIFGHTFGAACSRASNNYPSRSTDTLKNTTRIPRRSPGGPRPRRFLKKSGARKTLEHVEQSEALHYMGGFTGYLGFSIRIQRQSMLLGVGDKLLFHPGKERREVAR